MSRRIGIALVAAGLLCGLVALGLSLTDDAASRPAAITGTTPGGDPPDTHAPGTSGEATTPGTREGDTLPPNDIDALRPLFDPLLAEHGLRLTRGALVDVSDGYEISDSGTHLALYVEPLDDASYSMGDYVDGIYTVTALMTPIVFDTWSGVESWDVCQEPSQAEDPSDAPIPVTQIELDRRAAEGYDWTAGDLPSLLAYVDADPDGARLVVSAPVGDSIEYEQARAEAGLVVR